MKFENVKRDISIKEDEIEYLKYEFEIVRKEFFFKDGEFKILLEKIEQIMKEKLDLIVEVMIFWERVIIFEGDVQKEKVGREGLERQFVEFLVKGEIDVKFMSEQIVEI